MIYPSNVKKLAARCMEIYGSKWPAEVSFNILMTLRCPFECAHCLQDSSPRSPSAVFGDDDIRGTLNLCDALRATFGDELNFGFNFVGGEPTLYPAALANALRWFDGWGAMEMTTNGWWLRGVAPFVRTMDVLHDYLEGRTLNVRISHSPYHKVFRTRGELRAVEEMLRIGSEGARDAFPSEVFEHLFSSFEAAFLAAEGKGAVDCPECGKAADLTSTIRARCPQCSEEFDLDDADSEIFVERMDSRLYGFRSLGFFSESLLKAMACLAVFVDDQSNVSLTHNGRAAKNQLASKGGSCHHASPIFSMAPGGIVSDACCSGGGGTPFGRVSEGVVLAVRRLQLMDILEKRFAVSGPLGRYHPNYDGMGACEACGSITKGLVNSRKRREEAEQVIKYIRHYGIRKRKSACIGAVR